MAGFLPVWLQPGRGPVITTIIHKFENHSLLGYDGMHLSAGVPAFQRTLSTKQCNVTFTNNFSPGLISSWMQFLFVRVVPKCSMLSNYLLPEREREREREREEEEEVQEGWRKWLNEELHTL